MKSEIAIKSIGTNMIVFFATPDAAQSMTEFGKVETWVELPEYVLWLDSRFDRAEVEAYIQNYGKP